MVQSLALSFVWIVRIGIFDLSSSFIPTICASGLPAYIIKNYICDEMNKLFCINCKSAFLIIV